jgi:retron-type reverse transcriptase
MAAELRIGGFIPSGVTRHITQTARCMSLSPNHCADAVQGFFEVILGGYILTGIERHAARYGRRKAAREAKRNEKLMPYDDFSQITDADNLYSSFKNSRRNVAWKESVQRYEANAMRNIAETRRKLIAGESIQSGFMEFTLNERGKTRHIKSVHISERIVQKALCDYVLVPILSNPLIYDNGASIKGKGAHFALRRLVAHLSRFYRQNGFANSGYALQIDFTKFFDNIRHDILFALLDGHISDERVKGLVRRFVSVFGNGKSLGLGSQVSQISAIFYPDKLDHHIKEKLHIKYYGRYMDDLYLIHADKSYLEYCLAEISKVCQTLGIIINIKKTKIVKLSDGLEFLKGKYVLLETGKILRLPGRDSARRMRRKLKKFKGFVDAKKMSFDDLRCAYQSWRGNYTRRFNAYHRVRYMDKLYNDLFIKNRNHRR